MRYASASRRNDLEEGPEERVWRKGLEKDLEKVWRKSGGNTMS
jgi:hypothetical protein